MTEILSDISKKHTALALGTFDGLHLGHIAVINSAIEQISNGLLPLALMFSVHPQKILNGSSPSELFWGKVKDKAFKNAGIDVYYLDFKEVMNLSSQDFFNKILIEKLNAKHLSCGYNYRFGKDATGDVDLLSKLCNQANIGLSVAKQVEYNNEPVSSTKIRNYLKEGNIEKANGMLGRAFSYAFTVVGGDKRGRLLGAPTINQFFTETHSIPKFGVYASKTFVEGKWHTSVTNIGLRPTFQGNSPRSETCILDYSGNLYGQTIEVALIKYLRHEKKFPSTQDLCKQIQKDAQAAKDTVALLNDSLKFV